MVNGLVSVEIIDSIKSLVPVLDAPGARLPLQHVTGELARIEQLYALLGQPVRYVLATTATREICGLLPVYPTSRPFDSGADPALLFDQRQPAREWANGTCLGSNGTLPNWVAASAEFRHAALSAIFDVGFALAVDAGSDFVCVPKIEDHLLAEVAASLPASEFDSYAMHEAIMDVPFSSYDEYVESLPARRRKYVRRQRRVFAESGLQVAEANLEDTCRELAPLLWNVEHKYGGQQSVEFLEIYLLGLAMGKNCTTLIAHDGTAPVAFSVISQHGRNWRMRAWGCDHDKTDGTFAYFNLSIYEPLALAAARGARTLILGTEALELKQERGATTRRLTTLGIPC
jgi:hypothetical protein